MIIQCPKCRRQYNVDAEKITELGVKMTCPACKHQFKLKRKQDEEPKPSPKAPKTPPCSVCGAPSTHVLRGPPPKALCEQHFQTEKEKETRFFEPEGGTAPERSGSEDLEFDPPDARDTVFAEPPKKAKPAQPVGPASLPVSPSIKAPPDADPAFESFDDDFDFFDGPAATTAKPGAAKPGATPAPKPGPGATPAPKPAPGVTRPPAPPKAQPPAPVENDIDFDFNSPAPPPPAPTPPDPTPPAGAADPFLPGGGDMTVPAFDEDAFLPKPGAPPAAAAAPGPDEDAPVFLPGPGVDPSGPEDIPDSDFLPPAEPDFAAEFKKQADPLAASGPKAGKDLSHAGAAFEDVDAGFAWENPFKDKEAEAAPPRPPEVKEPPKKPEAPIRVAKKQKPATPARAMVTLAAVAAAFLLAGFLALANLAQTSTRHPTAASFPAWQGNLAPELAAATPADWAADIRKLRIPGKQTDPVKAAADYFYKDTWEGYDKALEEIVIGLGEEPNKPEYLSTRISLLAFRESLGRDGKTIFAVTAAKQELETVKALPGVEWDDPYTKRARAHVMIFNNEVAAGWDLLESLDEDKKNDPIVHYLRGMCILHGKDGGRLAALEEFRKAVKLAPNFVRARWEMVDLYIQGGTAAQKSEAIDQLKQIQLVSAYRPGVDSRLKELEGRLGPEGGNPLSPDDNVKPAIPQPPKLRGLGDTGFQAATTIKNAVDVAEPKIRKMRLD